MPHRPACSKVEWMTRDELETLREGWDFEAERAGGRSGGGELPASLWETYSAMAVSEPRNPALQRLFELLRLGEREGSGGPTMRRVWREQHWRAPRIWEDVENNETHLQPPLESLLPEVAVEALVERWGDDFKGQDELGRIILVTAEAEGSTSHGRIRELSDAHPHDITQKLRELVRSGMLESQGRTRNMTYWPKSSSRRKLTTASLFPSNLSLPLEDASSTQSSSSSTQSGLNSTQSGSRLPQSLPQSGSSPSQSSSRYRQNLVDDSRPQLSQDSHQAEPDAGREYEVARPDPVAEVATSGWAPASKVRSAILTLCKQGFQSASELASNLNREAKTLRQNYLSKMYAEGKLEVLYPETPSHPEQKYRAVQSPETNKP